jgi:glycosyltransferase involved in cell wall biosynthesis
MWTLNDPLVHAIGWFDGRYGYNVHTRNLFEALSARLPVVASPMRVLEGPQEADKREIAQTFAPHRRIATIALLYGSLTGVLDGASGTRIAYTVWESTKLPDAWFEPLSKADRIWTASAWGKRVFVANGFDPERIDVVPEGVDPETFNPEVAPSAALPAGDVFRFLAVGRWEKRKGLAELVTAFDREFGPKDKVELVLAGLHANQPGLDLGAELRALRLERPHRLKIIPAVKTHQAFAALYTACDAFVAPSRAEGWGLPISEAMACGLPVIVTGYSGPTEFIGPHARRIAHRLTPIDVPYFERSDGDLGVWAEPDWCHLRYLMRTMMSDRNSARELGLAGSHFIRNRYSWEASAEIAKQTIQNILQSQSISPGDGITS